MMWFFRTCVIAGTALAVFLSGAALFLNYEDRRQLMDQADRYERLVAVSWGDGAAGKAIYGAYVYCDEPVDRGRVPVMLEVRITRSRPGSNYSHVPRQIGWASDMADATARWEAIRWSPAGLHVGLGSEAYLLERSELERHR